MKKVGLSLSFCVKDIIEGKINCSDVAFIYSATRAETLEHWKDVIRSYRERYWYANPERAERVAWHFIKEGLIIQPRLEGKILHYQGRKTGGSWIDQDKFNDFCKENLKGEYQPEWWME